MSAIESIFPEQLAQETAVAAIPKKNELGQDEFLKLMLAQLKHQDPFQPMENGEFVAQMAQFSTVAGIENMDKSLSGMSEAYPGTQLLQSSALIGRTALVAGSRATLGAESGISGFYNLEESSPDVTIDIHSESGVLVHHADLSAKSSGRHSFQWDGQLEDGSRAIAGNYLISITHGEKGSKAQAEVLIENKIASVSMSSGSTAISFETEEGNTVSLQDIEKLQ